MTYSASSGFVIRRAICGVCFVAIMLLFQQVLDLGTYLLWLGALTVLWVPASLINQILKPKDQIEIDNASNMVHVRFMTLSGGWGRARMELDRVRSVGEPQELGSCTFRRMEFPNFTRPLMRLVDLFEIEVVTDSRTYPVIGRRGDLERSEAIKFLRSAIFES